eukprot:2007192-Rhodomonas_salina.1
MKGLIASIEELLANANPFHCFRHLLGNLRTKVSVSKAQIQPMWKLQGSKTQKEFDDHKAALVYVNPKAVEWLMAVEGGRLERWSNFHATKIKKLRLHKHRTSNLVEGENSRLREARAKAMLEFLLDVCQVWTGWWSASFKEAAKCKKLGRYLMPWAQKHYEEQEQAANFLDGKILGERQVVTSVKVLGINRERTVTLLAADKRTLLQQCPC